jgi:hypothetical protein
MSMVNEAKLKQLIGQMLSDLGGASSVAMVRIGDALPGLKSRWRILLPTICSISSVKMCARRHDWPIFEQ